MFGLMGHSATHPCYICLAKKGEDGILDDGADLRNFKVGREQLNSLQRTKNPHKSAKLHGNQLKAPLLIDSDDRKYVDIAKPPTLHLKLAANHIVDELTKVWPEFKTFLAEKGIKTSDYFGGNLLEGNDVNKLFKKQKELEEEIPEEYHLFSKTLGCLQKVVKGCLEFSLDEDYANIISELKESYRQLMRDFGVSETVKFHILTTHIKPVVDQIGRALGESGEQEVEAAHSVFHQIWKKRFFVKYVSAGEEIYRQQYLKAVKTFNREHLS